MDVGKYQFTVRGAQWPIEEARRNSGSSGYEVTAFRKRSNMNALHRVTDRSGSRKASFKNWNGVVGVKGRFSFGANREWFFPYYADVGASQSELTYQLMAGIGYALHGARPSRNGATSTTTSAILSTS
jgi:hypothetical protein